MKTKGIPVICVLSIVAVALAAEKVHNLKAVHKMAGKQTRYESVAFDKWVIGFAGNEKQMNCNSDLFSFCAIRDKDDAKVFMVQLQPTTVKPPKHPAGVPEPPVRTVYIDLDGDSELDVMVKRAPGKNDRAHILLDDKWTPVKEFDKQWIFVNQARSLDGKVTYRFGNRKWTTGRIRQGTR